MDSTFHFQTGQVHTERVVSFVLEYKMLSDREKRQCRACVVDLIRVVCIILLCVQLRGVARISARGFPRASATKAPRGVCDAY